MAQPYHGNLITKTNKQKATTKLVSHYIEIFSCLYVLQSNIIVQSMDSGTSSQPMLQIIAFVYFVLFLSYYHCFKALVTPWRLRFTYFNSHCNVFVFSGLKIDWSNCGRYLAVGGFTRLPNLLCQNQIHFYMSTGELAHCVSVPSQVILLFVISILVTFSPSFLSRETYPGCTFWMDGYTKVFLHFSITTSWTLMKLPTDDNKLILEKVLWRRETYPILLKNKICL